MKCQECRYLLFDYVDGKVTAETQKLIEDHLQNCPDCAKRLEALKSNKDQIDEATGLFFYLLRPSGGFKRFFFAGALLTILLFAILTYLHLKISIF